MLFAETDMKFSDESWRQINMRKVSHLIGAEMIHNLYDRHWPRINSLRFRHTITNFSQGIVESYAPVREWSYLQHWLSKKFILADTVLIREIRAILNPDYIFVNEIMHKVDTTDLESVDDQELALLLLDIMDFSLGDIYKLNVVQIEYSLNFALHRLLDKYEPNPQDRDHLLSRLIAPGELTVAQQEEIAFSRLVTIGRNSKISDPAHDSRLAGLISKHHNLYAGKHCAYGEEPPKIQDYINKYIVMYDSSKPLISEEDARIQIDIKKNTSLKLLSKLNDEKVALLCGLMADIGVFRDKNKAKLGETVIRRLRLLDEIARRTKVDRDNLNYYLVAEIAGLLDGGKELSKELISDRKNNGVCFKRMEDVKAGIEPIGNTSVQASGDDVLKGICASRGEIEGSVKIIRMRQDISKFIPGDIMVAIGTDFDLLEIMHLCGGIVTEEGGLLSHASVVSRELEKPCIIGVMNATKVLNDNDRISLDATNGVIRILERVERS